MKQTFIALISLLFISAAVGQADDSNLPGPFPASPLASVPESPDPAAFMPLEMRWRDFAVKEYMRAPVGSEVGALNLAAMGDEAAFHLFFIMNHSEPFTVRQTLRVIDMLHRAFSNPSAIRSASDQKPAAALMLLGLLQKTAMDQDVKDQIVIQTNFLKSVPEKILPFPMSTAPPHQGVMPMIEDFK